jgi:uncharacterized protein (DUF2237 family)
MPDCITYNGKPDSEFKGLRGWQPGGWWLCFCQAREFADIGEAPGAGIVTAEFNAFGRVAGGESHAERSSASWRGTANIINSDLFPTLYRS